MTADGLNWFLPFVAGAVSFLSPCVLALVPGYLSFISGVALDEIERGGGANRARVLAGSLLFFLGFSMIFILLGASASAAGTLLMAYRPMLNRVFGAFIVLMGLHLTGILRLQPLLREARLQVRLEGLGPLGPILLGMGFAFAWTPCIGPILAAILVYAGSTATIKTGVLMLAVYSLGLGIPFVLSGLALTRAFHVFRRVRSAGAILERASGIALATIGMLLFTNRIFYFNIVAQRLFIRLGLDLWRFF
jgi:cytochrome c-type biogenesis protein